MIWPVIYTVYPFYHYFTSNFDRFGVFLFQFYFIYFFFNQVLNIVFLTCSMFPCSMNHLYIFPVIIRVWIFFLWILMNKFICIFTLYDITNLLRLLSSRSIKVLNKFLLPSSLPMYAIALWTQKLIFHVCVLLGGYCNSGHITKLTLKKLYCFADTVEGIDAQVVNAYIIHDQESKQRFRFLSLCQRTIMCRVEELSIMEDSSCVSGAGHGRAQVRLSFRFCC